MVLERFRSSAQLTLPLEGCAEILAALAARWGILLLPLAPAAAPGARGLRLEGWIFRLLAGPGSSSLPSFLQRRGLVRTHDTVPDPTSGGRLTRGDQRSPLCSLTLRGVDQCQDVLEPWRRRSAILRRDGRMPQQELGHLQGLRRGGISELQAATRPRLALLRGDGGISRRLGCW